MEGTGRGNGGSSGGTMEGIGRENGGNSEGKGKN